MALRPGQSLGPYRIEGLIGVGGFASVYRARDDRIRTSVAIKVLAENHAALPEVRERFFNEGHVLRRVGSTALVPVYDVGESDGQPYLVLGLANRSDMANRADQRGLLPTVDDVRLVVTMLGTALEDLAAADVVHRDIKPSNVLITTKTAETSRRQHLFVFDPDERLMLSDFGLAKDLLDASGVTIGSGTAGYAAPEQGGPLGRVTHQTDIYGASALVYWLITNQVPVRDHRAGGDDGKDGQLAWPTEPLTRESRAILTALWPALERGLAVQPQDRQSSGRAWAEEILSLLDEPALGKQQTPVKPITRAPSASQSERQSGRQLRKPLLAAAVVGGLILAAAGLWLALVDRSDAGQPTLEATPASSFSSQSQTSEQGTPTSSTVQNQTSELPSPTSTTAPGQASDGVADDVSALGEADYGQLWLDGPILTAPSDTEVLAAELIEQLDAVDTVRFEPGSSDVLAASGVDQVGPLLTTGVRVELRGYDDGDTQPSIGAERADALRRHLVERYGLAPNLLIPTSAEASAPDADEAGAVLVVVQDNTEGGLLHSTWTSTQGENEDRWVEPNRQVIIGGLRTAFNSCESRCMIQVEGYVTPGDSGRHSFSLSADELAGLWVSTSRDLADLEPVAYVGPTDIGEESQPLQQTVEVELVAGEPIYVRLRTIDSGGDDFAEVVWKSPLSDSVEPISALVLTPPQAESS